MVIEIRNFSSLQLLNRACAPTKNGRGSSLDATVQHLHEVWQPICRQLDCDPTNFWDLHLASHKQTMALVETGSASHVRKEIRERHRLQNRVRRFVQENADYYLTNLSTSQWGRRFVDASFIQESSRQAFRRYVNAGRASMLLGLKPNRNCKR